MIVLGFVAAVVHIQLVATANHCDEAWPTSCPSSTAATSWCPSCRQRSRPTPPASEAAGRSPVRWQRWPTAPAGGPTGCRRPTTWRRDQAGGRARPPPDPAGDPARPPGRSALRRGPPPAGAQRRPGPERLRFYNGNVRAHNNTPSSTREDRGRARQPATPDLLPTGGRELPTVTPRRPLTGADWPHDRGGADTAGGGHRGGVGRRGVRSPPVGPPRGGGLCPPPLRPVADRVPRDPLRGPGPGRDQPVGPALGRPGRPCPGGPQGPAHRRGGSVVRASVRPRHHRGLGPERDRGGGAAQPTRARVDGGARGGLLRGRAGGSRPHPPGPTPA